MKKINLTLSRRSSLFPILQLMASLLVFSFIVCSCKKFVEIPAPMDSITDKEIYSTDQSAVTILNGLYTNMADPGFGNGNTTFSGLQSIHVSTSLSADELFLTSLGVNERAFFTNEANLTGSRSWAPLYNLIFKCNAALEGISASQTLSRAVKPQLLGEAYFLRAYFYFYLVNQFGTVPLATSTDYAANALLSRAPVTDVYKLVIADLKKAQELLSTQYLNGFANGPSLERTRPTKWAATALLARAYLYSGDDVNAALQASVILDNTALYGMPALNSAFLKTSREAIWQLQPVEPTWNTTDGKLFVIPGAFSASNPVYLNPSLVNSFEPGDLRAVNGNWVNTITISGKPYKYAYKYKVSAPNAAITTGTGTQNMSEFMMQLRLAEQYLIRAEARVHTGNLPGAINDLDSVRKRAGLPLISATDPGISQAALLDKILHERQVELFTEGGHRWFDLRRSGKIDAVMTVEAPLKGGSWEPYKALFPLSSTELLIAPNLTQTPGYPN